MIIRRSFIRVLITRIGLTKSVSQLRMVETSQIPQKFFDFYSDIFGTVVTGRVSIDIIIVQQDPVLTH